MTKAQRLVKRCAAYFINFTAAGVLQVLAARFYRFILAMCEKKSWCQMKISLRKKLSLAFLIALPIILFAMLRDKASWRPQRLLTSTYMSAFAISPDDQWLAFTTTDKDGEIFVSELPSGKVVKHWKISHRISAMKFSPDGKTVAMSWFEPDNEGGTKSLGVTLRDVRGNLHELQPVTKILSIDSPQQLRFSPDGKTLWLASSQNLRAWNLSDGKLQWQWRSGKLEPYAPSSSVAISEDCRFYFRCDGDSYLVWDIVQKKPALSFKNAAFSGDNMEFLPDASLAYYFDRRKMTLGPKTSFNIILDTRTGHELWRTASDQEPMFAGNRVLFLKENKFKVCNARTGKFLCDLPARPQSYVLPASSKDWLYSGADNGTDYFRQRFR